LQLLTSTGGSNNTVKGNTFYNVSIGVQNGGNQVGTGNNVSANLFYIPRGSKPRYLFYEIPIEAKSVVYIANMICCPTKAYTVSSLINFLGTSAGRLNSTSFCKIDKTAVNLSSTASDTDSILLNPKSASKLVSLPSGVQFKTVHGVVKSGRVPVDSFSSLILFGKGKVIYDENPYY
jgi:hypothetical protein